MLKIGELAKRSGLSIRTLHHYDEFGLLMPSGHTDAGYRLYSVQDVKQLQHILSLKQLGFSLKKIAEILHSETLSLSQTINEQIQYVEKSILSRSALLKQLNCLKDKFSSGENIAIDDFLETMEMMKMYEKYFDEEQLAKLAKVREELGAEKLKALGQKSWPELIAKVKKAMDNQLAVDSKEVQTLVKQWMELANQFTGGDSQVAESVSKMYQQEKGLQDKTGIHQPMMTFISQAWKHAQSTNKPEPHL